jgi:hypothetical protein
MTQYLYEGDRILGISTNFEYANDGWEPYLGFRAGNAKNDAWNGWNRTYSARGELRARMEKGKTIDTLNPKNDLDTISKSYEQTRIYIDSMLFMLQNNMV